MGVKNLSTQISWGLSSIHPSILAIFVNSSGLLKGMTLLQKELGQLFSQADFQ